MTPHGPRLIGLTGYARSGKDSTATVLAEQHGFATVAIGDTLRTMLEILDPALYEDSGQGATVYESSYSSLLAAHGYEGLKGHDQYGSQVRELLQGLGDAVRDPDTFGPDALADVAARRLVPLLAAGRSVVVSDVRTAGDAAMVGRLGGYLWRVDRPGVGPANGHHTEVLPRAELDTVIANDGTLEDLRYKVALALSVPPVVVGVRTSGKLGAIKGGRKR